MPKGPKGEHRPADVIGAAVKVMRIATGEEQEDVVAAGSKAVEAGKRGGAMRAERLNGQQKTTIARKAADARWRKAPVETG